MTFYLGTHKACWLARTDVPLFVSRRTLAPMRTLPRSLGPWALDSGGFTELSMHGSWQTSHRQYIDEVRRFAAEIGNLQWAAVQDWMCEPAVLEKTGKSIAEHQRLTTWSYLTLKGIAPELPWVPVLQGFSRDDYLRHLDEYHRALPFPLKAFRLVGLGSVCRRQNTTQAEEIVRELHGLGLKVHAFGFKLQGLRRCGRYLASSDSMAWSFDARRAPPLPGCSHANCANWKQLAQRWREKALRAARASERSEQLLLFS